MKKSELIIRLAERFPHIAKSDMEKIVNIIIDKVIEALENNDRVEIRGFGSLFVKYRRAREARNPKTGQRVMIEDKYVPFFKVGKELKELINKNG
ncbi:MAG: integration host factor subunit beta [Deltaproteobacteria bacterium]|nr:integration host factor subunit beta [Deltaproteobacteria bacterium]